MQIILGLALSAFFVLIPNTCTTNPIYIGRAVCKSYSNVVRLLIVKLIMNNIKNKGRHLRILIIFVLLSKKL